MSAQPKNKQSDDKLNYTIQQEETKKFNEMIKTLNNIKEVKQNIKYLQNVIKDAKEYSIIQQKKYGNEEDNTELIATAKLEKSFWKLDLEMYENQLDDQYDDIVDYLNTLVLTDRTIFEYTYKDGSIEWVAISANSVREFKKKLREGLFDIETENSYESDSIDKLKIKEIVDVKILKAKAQTKSNDGKFFHYYNKTILDLTEFQIYRKDQKIDTTNCLVFALNKMGVNTDAIKTSCVGSIPRLKLSKIADELKIQINLHYEKRPNVLATQLYTKNKTYPKVDLCLFKNHYFAYKTVPYHMFAINDYEIYRTNKVKNRETAYKWDSKGYCEHKTEYSIKSITFIKEMFNKGFFEPMSYLNSKDNPIVTPHLSKFPLTLAQTEFIDMKAKCDINPYKQKTDFYNQQNLDKTTINKKICDWVAEDFNKNKITYKKGKAIENIYFADCEATTDGDKHKVFMVCFSEIREKNIHTFIGEDCIWKFLNKVKNNSLVYFHNLKYDWQFIYDKIMVVSSCEVKNKLYSVTAMRNIKFVDSYKMISTALHNFGKSFQLDITKQECPYDVFNTENIKKPFVSVKEVEDYYGKDVKSYQTFLTQAKNFIRRGVKFDHMDYCSFYCQRDVDVLKQGMMIFNYQIRSELGINTFQYLTSAGVALDYMIHEGCFDGVSQLSGDNRKFCEEAAWGGRVAIQGNKPRHVKKRLQDFDAVSLYPSAMSRLRGYPMGLPKKFKNELPTNCYDNYFIVKIILHEVRKWPSLATFRIKHNEKILWPTEEDADKCKDIELIVDMVTLEDMIKYHDIKFSVVEGLYWNDGFNNKVVGVIRKLYQLRKQYKKNKNPIEQVYKLIMNSAYGKTLTKEAKYKTIYKYKFDEMDRYYDKNAGLVESILHVPFSGKFDGAEPFFYKIKTKENFIKHTNAVHCGAYVLSMSKRILNEVIDCADEIECTWNYKDTDSLHIEDEKIQELELKFQEKFGRRLLPEEGDEIGELGQFHTDFDLYGSKTPVAIESMFLAPKTYCDRLVCKKNSQIKGFHFRIKGICKESLLDEVENNYQDDIMSLYTSGNVIEFNMLVGRKAKFEFDKKGGVSSLKEFHRKVNFGI